LEIARRFLNVEQLADAIRPREYGDIRYRRVQEPAPQPVPPPNQALLPEVIEEPEQIQAPLPDVVQYPRKVRFRQEHQEPAAAAAAPIEPEQIQREPQEQAAAAAAPTERSAGASESEEETEEETEDELQLCHLSSAEGSSDDSSSTNEDRRGFERELDRNPALRAAYNRSEEARRKRGHFNARPGHLLTRRHTRGRETRNPNV
jgi:outer membrane biosynthesis protein TonB